MQTKIIEATNGIANWGKFLVGRLDEEWQRRTAVPCTRNDGPLLSTLGWGRNNLWVLDLQTGEGAYFLPGGCAPADLTKHAIWVCPLFEPFLAWLYQQDLTTLDQLPDHVSLPKAPFALRGYRHPGPSAHAVAQS